MNLALGLHSAAAYRFSDAAGIAEIVLGLIILGLRWRWPLLLTLLLMLLMTTFVAILMPAYFTNAFNAATLNVATAALAGAALLLGRLVPSAGRCLRRPPSEPTA